MARKKHIVGNWKMNHNIASIREFFSTIGTKNSQYRALAGIAPQSIHLSLVRELAPQNFWVGAQNCSYESKGAFTGEISPAVIKDSGLDFVIVGHSERRSIFKESYEELALKTKLALNANLQAIFCVGESLEERESDKTFEVIEEQLVQGLKQLPEENRDRLIIAYEPVWAIGTGKTATPEQAEEVHAFIRERASFLKLNSQELIILYGGSVKPSNAADLLSKENIDGGLVGGASLDVNDFDQLCLIASEFD